MYVLARVHKQIHVIGCQIEGYGSCERSSVNQQLSAYMYVACIIYYRLTILRLLLQMRSFAYLCRG